MKLLITALFIIFSLQAFATASDGFNKRFHLERRDGKVVTIRDLSLEGEVALSSYVAFIKNLLINEQTKLVNNFVNGNQGYEQEVARLLGEDANFYTRASKDDRVGQVIDSLKELARIDVEAVFNDPAFQDVLNSFGGKLLEALAFLDPTVLAKLDGPRFFYKRNVVHKAVEFGLSYAKKKLTWIPVLNTATFVIVQVEKMIKDRRVFHQNMLLHYFENFDPSELGMTKEDVDHAFSSIYESQIPWFNKWESDAAVVTWNSYGTDKFYKSVRFVNSQLRVNKHKYSRLGERFNFAFVEGEFNGERVVLNLFNKDNMFSKDFAIAYYQDEPLRVARKRAVLQLAELGLSFLSLPDWMKSSMESYIKSFYYQQQLIEGALYGHFESIGDVKMMEQIKMNQLNPFELSAI